MTIKGDVGCPGPLEAWARPMAKTIVKRSALRADFGEKHEPVDATTQALHIAAIRGPFAHLSEGIHGRKIIRVRSGFAVADQLPIIAGSNGCRTGSWVTAAAGVLPGAHALVRIAPTPYGDFVSMYSPGRHWSSE